jgi:hypothetical protein
VASSAGIEGQPRPIGVTTPGRPDQSWRLEDHLDRRG